MKSFLVADNSTANAPSLWVSRNRVTRIGRLPNRSLRSQTVTGKGGGAGSRGAGVSGAQPTAEIFIDPETGRRMRVWFDARTGQRDYRPE